MLDEIAQVELTIQNPKAELFKTTDKNKII